MELQRERALCHEKRVFYLTQSGEKKLRKKARTNVLCEYFLRIRLITTSQGFVIFGSINLFNFLPLSVIRLRNQHQIFSAEFA